jgi:hypothetical protein
MAPVKGSRLSPTTAAFRQIIRELIHGLCAVPKDLRLEWIDELMKAGHKTDSLPPEESVVRMVLTNLDVAEDVANARRAGLLPKPYPIVGAPKG